MKTFPLLTIIHEPSACDIVITIFWSSLGTPLPDSFPHQMRDGRTYASGSAYEVMSALEARKANGRRPDVYDFRKTMIPSTPINDRNGRTEANHQWERLEDFFSEHFETADKRILLAVEKFRELEDFERKIETALSTTVGGGMAGTPTATTTQSTCETDSKSIS